MVLDNNKNYDELFAKEEAYLEETLNYLRERISYLVKNNLRREEESIELKKMAYDQGLEMRETDGNSHFDSSMVQNELRELAEIIYYQSTEYQLLSRLYNRPFFGHIDFKFDGDEETNEIYIGLKDIVDTDQLKQYAVDWRAPIANLYYDYNESGPASYINNENEITGQLENKFQLVVEKAKLKSVLDTAEQINDEVLQMILSQMGTAGMRNIVETIQAQQNEIIRSEMNRTILVQGVAGSGKTSIALHRAAYLLYLNKHMQAEDMILISPSASFVAYIASVLPSLGERNISYMTMEDLIRDELSDAFGRYETYNFEEATREKLQALSEFNLIDEIDEFVEFFTDAVFTPKSIKLDEELVISAGQISRMYKHNFSFIPSFAREAEMLAQINENVLSNEQFQEHQEQITEELSEMYLVKTLDKVYRIFTAWLIENKGYSADLFVEKQEETFDKVDLGLMALIKVKLYGKSDTDWVKHLIVDEMQDLLPVEHELLKLLFSSPRTVLGDENQAVRYELPEDFLNKLTELYKKDKFRVETFRLDKSYRSTSEITNFSKKIINVNSIQAIDRHGEEVQIVELAEGQDKELAKEIYQTLLSWRAKGFNNAAVVAKDKDELLFFKEELNRLMSEDSDSDNFVLNTYLRDEDEFAVTLTDIAGSKGIEFDGVIILNANKNNYNTNLDRTKLYVACTRPLHELKIYSLGELSEFLDC